MCISTGATHRATVAQYLTNPPVRRFTLNSNRSSMSLFLTRSHQGIWQPQRLTRTEQHVLQFTANLSQTLCTRPKPTQLTA